MPPWSVPQVFVIVLRTIRRQPLALLLSLAALPALWSVPAELAYQQWLPDATAETGPSRPSAAFTASFAIAIWNSIWAAGTTRIGIDAARGLPVRFRHLLDGIAYTPLMVCTALPLLPIELLALLPRDEDTAYLPLLFGAVLVITVVLLLRTALWVPFMVDAGTSLWAGLVASWEATRDRAGQILLLAVLLVLPLLPLAALELATFTRAYVAIGLTGLFYTLAVGKLYVLAHDPAQPSFLRAS